MNSVPIKKGNILSPIPKDADEEIFQTLASSDSVRIERIVSKGHASPPDFWYDQKDHEWVMVIQGRATIRFFENDQTLELIKGEYINIPAHTRHRVEHTDPDQETVWLAIHYPPTGGGGS